MADPPPYPDSNAETGVGPDPGSTTARPLWVKVFGIIALVVILLFVIVMVAGGGEHGPGRHTGGSGGETPPSTVTEHRPPQGGHSP